MALVLRRCPASQVSHQDQPAIGVPLQAHALEVLYRPPVLGKHLGQWVAEDRQAAVDVEEGAEDIGQGMARFGEPDWRARAARCRRASRQ